MHKMTLLVVLIVVGCLGVPSDIEPVQGFELDRYLGRWYEIARLDHSFERGLTHVTADYILRDDGRVRVLNRGYRPEKNRWETEEGVAVFVGPPEEGRLKVSFFGPFYGAYNIIALDRGAYGYAMVCGPNRGYLWILARQPYLTPEVLTDLTDRARILGFAVEELIMVDHEPLDQPRTGGG
jgi:apolipoprotein D and lipocalin family protein